MSTYIKKLNRYVDVTPAGCWILLTKNTQQPIVTLSNGYTPVTINGNRVLAHRWSWESFNGSIQNGLVIDHLCKNPTCINPSHLEPVTQKTNLLRGDTFQAKNASKTHCPHGHKYTKANLINRGDGRRSCKICHRDNARATRNQKG